MNQSTSTVSPTQKCVEVTHWMEKVRARARVGNGVMGGGGVRSGLRHQKSDDVLTPYGSAQSSQYTEQKSGFDSIMIYSNALTVDLCNNAFASPFRFHMYRGCDFCCCCVHNYP